MKTVQGKLTILVDNLVPGKSRFIGEHGFSMFVETNDGNYLFDTGRGKSIIHNAILRQKDLRDIKGIVLSHSHADHTGGLPEVLVYHSNIAVFAHPDIFLNRYRLNKKGEKRFSGMPFRREYIEKIGADFRFNTAERELAPGIHLTGVVPRVTPFEIGDMSGRYIEKSGETVQDIIEDDQSLILNTRRGYVIVLGCAHSGLFNIISHALQVFGKKPVYAIIGGTHLGYVEDTQIKKTIEALRELKVSHLIPSHCTGIRTAARLAQEFPDSFQYSQVGLTLEF
jgi:7,8-dihydropterin-6-yl-methyl-4-(beta-D-ribofuranosyl)aminobenzene 5'-phosphate synthase